MKTGESVRSSSQIKRLNNFFDGIPLTRQQMLLFAVVVMAYFFEQLDNNNFSYVAPALIKSWNIDRSVIAQISSLYFLGMTAGGVFGGMLSDFFGRRKAFLSGMFLVPITEIINGSASNVTVFMISRVITGFGIFLILVVAATYMAEMTPKEIRGKAYNISAAVGFLALPAIGFISRAIIPIAPEAWRYVFFLGALGFIPFFIGLKYLKESPRWLLNKGRKDEAEKVCEELTGIAVDLSEAAKNILPKIKMLRVILGMFEIRYIKRSILFLLANTSLAIAILVVAIWVPTLLNHKGFDLRTSLTISATLQFGAPLGLFLSSFFTDKGGRKVPLSTFLLLSGLAAVLFAFTGNDVTLAIVSGFSLILLMNCTNFTMNSYIQESYPTQMRSSTYGMINAISRFSVSGAQLVVPVVMTSYGFSGVFSGVAMLFAFTAFLIMAFGRRTAGKSLEEISN